MNDDQFKTEVIRHLKYLLFTIWLMFLILLISALSGCQIDLTRYPDVQYVDYIGKGGPLGMFEIYGFTEPHGTIYIKNRNFLEYIIFPLPDSWILAHELEHREDFEEQFWN